MALRIYPAVGIARLGNSPDQFFIGPEAMWSPGHDVDAGGAETPVTSFKDNQLRIKRQAARFRIFDVPDDGSPAQPFQLPAGATLEWTVHVANKKSAIVRSSSPPSAPVRPQLSGNSGPRTIDPEPRTISGPSSGPVAFDTGKFEGRSVPLGELRTDAAQNLLVLGATGFSSSPSGAPLPSFYTNPGWHDDTCDGPVTARVTLEDGTLLSIEPAWVMVAPPDFAPDIASAVTLYDIMLQVGVQHLGVPAPSPVSFTQIIFPMLLRARRLHWVNNFGWDSISNDYEALADPSAGAEQLRRNAAEGVRSIEDVLHQFRLTNVQRAALSAWENGDFTSDWTGIPAPSGPLTPAGLTRSALDGTTGQGFFPGIEMGILSRDQTLYSRPFDFRFDHNQLSAGMATAQMAVPWQADFSDCGTSWWPTQRPNQVFRVPDDLARVEWDRGANSRRKMVDHFAKLGMITAQQDSQGNLVFAESQRAPNHTFL